MKPQDVPQYLVEAAAATRPLPDGPIPPDVEREIRRELAFVLPAFGEKLYSDIETAMNKRAPGCACPPDSMKSCGWRAGHGAAADLVREAVKGSW